MISFFIVFLFGISSYTTPVSGVQDEKPELLSWKSDYRLTWDDFKGTPEEDAPYAVAATTFSGISYKYNYKFNKAGEGKFTFTVNCYFDKSKSWVKRGHDTKWVLSHEQLHFDIAELYSRKLRKGFLEAKLSKEGYEEEIILIHYQIYMDYLRTQKKYDKETHYANTRKPQKGWNAYVQKELKDLEPYANPLVGPVLCHPSGEALEKE